MALTDYKAINEGFYKEQKWALDRNKEKYLANALKLKLINSFLKPSEKDIVLDAGGGVGNWAFAIKDKVKKVIVLDISKIALSLIKEKDIGKKQGSLAKIPFDQNHFDKIICIDALEHLKKEDLPKALSELKRVLKPNGILAVYASCDGFYITKPWIKKIDKKDGHLSRLSFKEWKKLIPFKIERVIFFGHFFERIARWIFEFSIRLYSGLAGKKDIKQVKGEFKTTEKIPMIFKVYLRLLTLLTSLDIVLFGKIEGAAIFLRLRK